MIPWEHTSPSSADWPQQRFSHDPVFVASQRELRTLLISTAQSEVPTRRATPVATNDEGVWQNERRGSQNVNSNVAKAGTEVINGKGRQLEYLKNYVARVAPWVSHMKSPFLTVYDIGL